ncbi:hypothetical protein BE221DRAFT_2025 [Ostreococcus tauri]|uniref:UBA domain-containing protein n=1 Tax=Ostreococcus tauri TaxID=70448 RepID=A0A1Y5I048_OSTTA|nr:hypothetical protein BE221DRAFT_2025 [Ostreococcus tauri]
MLDLERRFRGAPFARALACGVVVATVYARTRARGATAASWIFADRDLASKSSASRVSWVLTRAVCGELAFAQDAFELVVGMSALSGTAVELERLASTRRLLGIVLAASIASRVCARAIENVFAVDASARVSGPYALVFALVWIWSVEKPATSSFAFGAFGPRFTIYFNDKSKMVLMSMLLALKGGVYGACAAICGAFGGYTVTHGIGTSNDALLVFPDWVVTVLRGGARKQPIYRMRAMRAAAGGGVPSRAPSEENIRLLVSMGFDAAVAARALRQANDDVPRATTILLGG